MNRTREFGCQSEEHERLPHAEHVFKLDIRPDIMSQIEGFKVRLLFPSREDAEKYVLSTWGSGGLGTYIHIVEVKI